MWISKKRYEDIVDRVYRLEEKNILEAYTSINTPFGTSNTVHHIPLKDIVSELLNYLGVTISWEPRQPARIIISQKEKKGVTK